jgi:subtilisin family serine protease
MFSIAPFAAILSAVLPPVQAEARAGVAAPSAAAEAAFARRLSGARLVGSFTLDGESPARLHGDSYTLQRVSKLEDGTWHFEASVEYRGTAIPVALALPVQWAGDTPVITLTDLLVPGVGTFTARVLVYRDEYAGTWSAGDHGGHMFGRIEKAAAGDDAKESAPADK